MSGHSKWSTIKRQKGAADQKRGQVFTKLSIAISLAVRLGGGGDPEQNFRLRLTIEKARMANMPKANIERAIEKGKGIGDGARLDEVAYEGFCPGGKGVFIVEAATDNKQRTTSEIKNIIDKSGGTFGQPGSVSYQFESKGAITIQKDNLNVDDVFLLAADAGAEDLEEVGDEIIVYTKPEDLNKVRETLLANKLVVQDAEIIRRPTITQEISEKDVAERIMALVEKLEDLDDVQKVYTNVVFSDSLVL